MKHGAAVALALVGLLVAACGGTGSGNGAPSSPPAPVAGTLHLTVDDATSTMAIQLCTDAGGGSLDVTAQGTEHPPSTLVANVAAQARNSTVVYTTIRADNTYTTYSMASGSVHDQNKTGAARIVLSGTAVEQGYDAAGQPSGTAASVALRLDGVCASVQPSKPVAESAPR